MWLKVATAFGVWRIQHTKTQQNAICILICYRSLNPNIQHIKYIVYKSQAVWYLEPSGREWSKSHGSIYSNAIIIKFHYKSWAAFGCQMMTSALQGSLRDHLAAKGCPGFVVEFNIYSIIGDDPLSSNSLLHKAPQLDNEAFIARSKHIGCLIE